MMLGLKRRLMPIRARKVPRARPSELTMATALLPSVTRPPQNVSVWVTLPLTSVTCSTTYAGAIQQFNGKAVMNRQILVDAVKGKLDPDFRPHHLSGTLGGRHYTKTPSYNRDFGFGRGGFRGGLRGGPRGGGSYAGRGRDIVPSGAPAGPRGGRSHGGGMNGSGPSFDDRRGGSSGSNMEPLGGRDRGFGSHGMADRGRGDERGGDRYHSSYDRGNDRGHDRERRYFDRDDDPYSRRRGDDGRGTKRVHERDDPGPAHKRIDDRDRRR